MHVKSVVDAKSSEFISNYTSGGTSADSRINRSPMEAVFLHEGHSRTYAPANFSNFRAQLV